MTRLWSGLSQTLVRASPPAEGDALSGYATARTLRSVQLALLALAVLGAAIGLSSFAASRAGLVDALAVPVTALLGYRIVGLVRGRNAARWIAVAILLGTLTLLGLTAAHVALPAAPWISICLVGAATGSLIVAATGPRLAATMLLGSAFPFGAWAGGGLAAAGLVPVAWLVVTAIGVTAIAGFAVDRLLRRVFALRASLEDRVAARTEALGRLATQLHQAREQERRRLARDLHDDTSQLLSSMRIEIGVIRQMPAQDPELRASVRRIDELIDKSFAAYRRMIKTLRPEILDARGFGPALRWLCETTAERTGIDIEIEGDDGFDALDPDTSLVAFRATQEALTNVARHADANTATVHATIRGNLLHLTVEDDGRGFRPAEVTSGHLGLLILEERARAAGGSVTVESMPGRGTRVELTLRVSGPDRADTRS